MHARKKRHGSLKVVMHVDLRNTNTKLDSKLDVRMSDASSTDSPSSSSASEDGGHPLDDYLRNVHGNEAEFNLVDTSRSGTSGDEDEQREVETEDETEVERSDVIERSVKRAPRSSGLSLPPPLQSLDADGGAVPAGIILVSNEGEMGNTDSLEYRKMSRPTRYFDGEAFDEPGGASSILCFKCGLVGHMARECKNPPKLRPCYLCAGYGHGSHACPQQACYRCGEAGHQARDCTGGRLEPWQEALKNVCRRCGRGEGDCRAAVGGDLLRAEGKCSGAYDGADLARVTCLSCGKVGHANCAALAATKAVKSCFNCGEAGHLGSECRAAPNAAVSAEHRRGAAQSHFGGGRGGGGGGGGGRGDRGYASVTYDGGGSYRGQSYHYRGRGRHGRPMERDDRLGVRSGMYR